MGVNYMGNQPTNLEKKQLNRVLLEKLLQDPLYGPIITDIVSQQEVGLEKYNSLLTLEKWDFIEFEGHLQQELTDAKVYATGLRQHYENWLANQDTYLVSQLESTRKQLREALEALDASVKENYRLKQQLGRR
jgi:hypothetical protein